jgi:dipeptidyl aminopeptidase/acylaminoacyl peptidase
MPSPDGKRPAFSALTRLYVIALPGGATQLLSRGDAREFQPAWSADGKWLAYVSWKSEEGQIWKRQSDGKREPIRLTRTAAFYRDPVWSPDGKRIVALRAPRREKIENPVEFGPSTGLDLVWVSAEVGEATLVSPACGASRPHFVRDAERIFVTTPQGLVSMRLDATDRQTHLGVTGKTTYSPGEPTPAEEILLRPDGRWALARVTNQLYLVALPRIGGEAPKFAVHEPSVALKKLTDIGADWAAWTDGSKTITWAIGSSFFRLPIDSIAFEPLKADEDAKEETRDRADAEKKEQKPKAEEIAVAVERPRHRLRGPSCSGERRSSPCVATRSSPMARSWSETTGSWPSGPEAQPRCRKERRSTTSREA